VFRDRDQIGLVIGEEEQVGLALPDEVVQSPGLGFAIVERNDRDTADPGLLQVAPQHRLPFRTAEWIRTLVLVLGASDRDR
jgi:hypothetical protein